MRETEETSPLGALSAPDRAVGLKQARRAVQEGRAAKVFLACDADPALTRSLAALCHERGIPVETRFTLRQIGKACGLSVGAAAAAVR